MRSGRTRWCKAIRELEELYEKREDEMVSYMLS